VSSATTPEGGPRDATPSLRAGDALTSEAGRISGRRNLGDHEATTLFWTVIPPPVERQ
jgi:hypothetical protein